MTSSGSVLLEKRGQAFWIVVNRPDKRNALNHEVISGIREGYRQAHEDPTIRVIVLTGAGDKAFCAGADLQPGAVSFDLSRPTLDFGELLRFTQEATLPTIARVNGTCVAGGMGLLSMADVAVAADHAMFGLPEVKVGLFPMQVFSLLQRLVPTRVLREWCLTGELFDAKTALHHSLINYAVPTSKLDEKTDWLIDRLVDKSPTAIQRGKYAMQAMASMSFDVCVTYAESQIALLSLSEDAKEGLAAFREKRKPKWTVPQASLRRD